MDFGCHFESDLLAQTSLVASFNNQEKQNWDDENPFERMLKWMFGATSVFPDAKPYSNKSYKHDKISAYFMDFLYL